MGKKGGRKLLIAHWEILSRITQIPTLISTSEDPEAQGGLCEATRLVTNTGGSGHRPPWVQLVLLQLGCVGLISISLSSPQTLPPPPTQVIFTF